MSENENQQPESEPVASQTTPTPEITDNGESEVVETSDEMDKEAIPSPSTSNPSPLTSMGKAKFPSKLTEKPKLQLLKVIVVKILRGTIWLLEKIVEKLEGEAVATATAKSPDAIAQSPTDTTIAQPIGEVTQKPAQDKQLSTLAKVGELWHGALSTIRALLPRKWRDKLSDLVLTGAIAGIAVILIFTKVALGPKTPEIPSQLVTEVPSETIETPSLSSESTTPAEVSQPVETAPPAETSPPEETSDNVEVSLPEETSDNVEVSLPEEIVASPTVELTPEERLIANIQSQLNEITDRYINGLIQSVQPNFRDSFLVVTISNSWYELDESQQNKLGDAILNKAQELDFSQLEIVNSGGNLIARSPVIGSHLVIFLRQ